MFLQLHYMELHLQSTLFIYNIYSWRKTIANFEMLNTFETGNCCCNVYSNPFLSFLKPLRFIGTTVIVCYRRKKGKPDLQVLM